MFSHILRRTTLSCSSSHNNGIFVLGRPCCVVLRSLTRQCLSPSVGDWRPSSRDDISVVPVTRCRRKPQVLSSVQQQHRSFASSSFLEAVKELRALSGAPIVECKKALTETAGAGGDDTTTDVRAAMDWLRENGAAKALRKVSGRRTAEGLIGLRISDDAKTASLVKVASETDFASRSDKFVSLVRTVALATLRHDPASIDGGDGGDELKESTVLQLTVDDGEKKAVKECLEEAIVAIRENLSVPAAVHLRVTAEDDDSILVGYVHNRVKDSSANAGTAAAVVEVASAKKASAGDDDDVRERLERVGKRLAMHVVAARPQYLARDDVPQDELERERSVLLKQLEEEQGRETKKKSQEILEKIVSGRLQKFYESVCLTQQAHMLEDKNPKVEKVLKAEGVDVKNFATLSIK